MPRLCCGRTSAAWRRFLSTCLSSSSELSPNSGWSAGISISSLASLLRPGVWPVRPARTFKRFCAHAQHCAITSREPSEPIPQAGSPGMPKRRIVDIRSEVPLLDVASYGRRGPGHRVPSKAELEHISRTVRRAPEVMVKVSGGARSVKGVAQHLGYIGREGRGEVQTDDGERLQGRGFERALPEDWDLDLDAHRHHTERAIAAGRKAPKLVHNIVFSMPKGTPPEKVLRAVQVFAREKF